MQSMKFWDSPAPRRRLRTAKGWRLSGATPLDRTLEVNEEETAPMGHFDKCLLLLVGSDNDVPEHSEKLESF
jgi:hypothetical protein